MQIKLYYMLNGASASIGAKSSCSEHKGPKPIESRESALAVWQVKQSGDA